MYIDFLQIGKKNMKKPTDTSALVPFYTEDPQNQTDRSISKKEPLRNSKEDLNGTPFVRHVI